MKLNNLIKYLFDFLHKFFLGLKHNAKDHQCSLPQSTSWFHASWKNREILIIEWFINMVTLLYKSNNHCRNSDRCELLNPLEPGNFNNKYL